MQKISLMIALAVLAAACSSVTESGSTVTTAVSSTTAPTTTEAPTTTTTTQAPLTGAACVTGSWELDSDPFFEEVTTVMIREEAPGEFRFVGGTYRISLSSDGVASEQREDWMFTVRTDFGDLILTVNAEAQGSYSVGDGLLSLELEQSSSNIDVLIDGLPVEMPDGGAPVAIPSVSFTDTPFTCSQDTLVVTADGVTSTWRRGT